MTMITCHWDGFLTIGIVLTFGCTTSPLTTHKRIFTLHKTASAWNTAKNVCHYDGGRLAKLDTQHLADVIDGFKNDEWFMDIANDYWIGLFDSDSPHGVYAWSDLCEPLGSYSPWYTGGHTEPNEIYSDHCVREGRWSSKWFTSRCSKRKPFICEKTDGPCTYLEYSNTSLTASTSLSSRNVLIYTSSGCQQYCQQEESAGKECWAVTFNHVTKECVVHFSNTNLVPRNTVPWTSDSQTVLFIRVCHEATVNPGTPPSRLVDERRSPQLQCHQPVLSYWLVSSAFDVLSTIAVSVETEMSTIPVTVSVFDGNIVPTSELDRIDVTPSNLFESRPALQRSNHFRKHSTPTSVVISTVTVSSSLTALPAFTFEGISPTSVSESRAMYSSSNWQYFTVSSTHQMGPLTDMNPARALYTSSMSPLTSAGFSEVTLFSSPVLLPSTETTAEMLTKDFHNSGTLHQTDPTAAKETSQVRSLNMLSTPILTLVSKDSQTIFTIDRMDKTGTTAVVPDKNASMCKCSCLSISVPTLHESSVFMASILKQLDIPKDSTWSFKRKRTSVLENRMSARGLGYSGAIVIGLVFGGLILLDFPLLWTDIYSLLTQLRTT